MPMLSSRSSTPLRRSALAVTAVLLFASPAWSQSDTPSKEKEQAKKEQATDSSTVVKMQRWTQKQWNELTQEWRKDRSKWDTCNRQAAKQKLKGQESWTYIYGCMKT